MQSAGRPLACLLYTSARIEGEIREAGKQADVVLVSIHAHETDAGDTKVPAMFLETFARRCVDAGADVIIGHGPHELRGIEIYKGCLLYTSHICALAACHTRFMEGRGDTDHGHSGLLCFQIARSGRISQVLSRSGKDHIPFP